MLERGCGRGEKVKRNPGGRMYKNYWRTVGLVMGCIMENDGYPDDRM